MCSSSKLPLTIPSITPVFSLLAIVCFVGLNAELINTPKSTTDGTSASPLNISISPQASISYCADNHCAFGYQPHSALVRCSFLPIEFLDCEEPEDLKGNYSRKEELGYGCVKFGGQRYEQVERTSVECTVLPGIECFGDRKFRREGFPCINYRGHYFTTTLLYSVLLGFLGMDRFCLGKTGTAVGKLLTLGGVGIWWIVDIVLLIVGILRPEDNSNWVPYA